MRAYAGLGKALDLFRTKQTILSKPSDDTFVDPDDRYRSYFRQWRIDNTVNPIPHDKDLPPQPNDVTPLGAFDHKKVSVIGCGQVGLAIAYAILNQDLCGSLALVDVNAAKLQCEAKDLLHGSAFHDRMSVEASDDYAVVKDSNLVVVTAGVAQNPGESRLSLVERNVQIMKNIIPKVLHHAPDATICIVSNPCDIMTAVTNRIAGLTQPGRIFGNGTCLDSSRLRSLIARAMDLDPGSIHGYVIGEHGDSSIAVWSSLRIGALPLLSNPQAAPDETLQSLHHDVVNAAGDVIKLKGYTNYAVGLTGAHIAKCVLDDARTILPVSTCVRGLYGIEEDVFLSVPCSLSSEGVQRIAVLPLTESEEAGFVASAREVWKVQKGIWNSL